MGEDQGGQRRRPRKKAPTRRKKKACYIGIDPGSKGFITVFDGVSIKLSEPISYLDRAPDFVALARTLKKCLEFDPLFCLLEEQQVMGREGARASFTLGRGFGALEQALALLEIPHAVVRPLAWKKRLKITVSRKMSHAAKKKLLKQKAIAKAQRLMPGFDFRATPRSKGPHDGKAESFLLAYLAREGWRG